MEKNLPKVFANPINKNLNNNLEYFVSNEVRKEKYIDKDLVLKKVNEIFALPSHVYKSKVKIEFEDNTSLETFLVGKNNNYLLALNGDKIPINKIVNIAKI